LICREYPKTWESGDEPYYAVDTAESRALLERYRAEVAKVPGLVVGGRLGEYRYYDMDQSVGRGLDAAGAFLA
jgi:UDP-galactopyranose mutase